MYVAANGSLIITSVVEADLAVYQCFAVNSVGEMSTAVLLSVFGALHIHGLLTVDFVQIIHSLPQPY